METFTMAVSSYVSVDSVAIIGFIKAAFMVMKFYAVCEDA